MSAVSAAQVRGDMLVAFPASDDRPGGADSMTRHIGSAATFRRRDELLARRAHGRRATAICSDHQSCSRSITRKWPLSAPVPP